MYNSQYYTCQEIDQRLLQGYLDDFNEINGSEVTKEAFHRRLLLALNNKNNGSNVKLSINTKSNWETLNPVLENYEIGFEKDTQRYKIGDGVTYWNELAYGHVDEYKNIAKDLNLLTNISGIEVTGTNATQLKAPSDYKAGDIFYVNEGTDGFNYSEYVNGIHYYIAKGKGLAGTALDDGTLFDKTYSSAEAVRLSTLYNTEVGFGHDAYDISDAYPNASPFASLQAALTAFTDTTKRKGGMTIKFIQGSAADVKYVQYRYLLSSTAANDFTNTANWQGVDDVITEESNNIPTSKAVTKYVDRSLYGLTEDITYVIESGSLNCWIDSNGKWYLNHSQKGTLIVCKSDWLGNEITILGPSSQYAAKIAFLKSDTISDGSLADYCDGENNRHDILSGTMETYTIPTDCAYIYFGVGTSNSDYIYRPQKVKIIYDNNGIIPQIEDRIEALEQKSTVDIDIDLSEIKDENWYYWINNSGNYSKTQGGSTGGNMGIFYPLKYKARQIYIEGSPWFISKVAFLKSPNGESPDYCNGETGRHEIEVGGTGTFTIPSDCKYIWFAISARTAADGYHKDTYRPRKVTLKGVVVDSNVFESINGKTTKHNRQYLITNGSKTFDYIRCQSQESIPVGSSAVSYADFIAQWDTFIGQHSELFTKAEIIESTTGNYPIYKYVYAPTYYEKTIFLTAGMHGDEYEGFWGLLRCMQYILDTNNNNELIKYIRNTCRVIIIPVLNPYGVQNKKRYSTSQNVDQNYNFDVAWGKCENMSGAYPFYYAEPKAVKTVCDEYDGEISFHIDFHTDPYNAGGLPANTSKCNYIEADEDSIIFPAAYELTIAEREHIKNDLYFQDISSNFVVWTNKAATSFRYMEWVRHIPSIIVETTTRKSSSDANGFAGASGSAEVMKVTVDWYLNCICMMLTNVL